MLTYDPAINAQRRAQQRGLSDKLEDIRTGRHFARTDLKQALGDIATGVKRQRQDIGLETRRGRQDIQRDFGQRSRGLDKRESDTRKQEARAQADFKTRLSDISRRFSELGQQQGEATNAAGVTGGGTAAASAAARRRNETFTREPIETAQRRTAEDLLTALSRIDEARGELGDTRSLALGRLGENRDLGLRRTRQDARRERQGKRRKFGRQRFDIGRLEGRSKREAAIGDADLTLQAIFQARERYPGAFTRKGALRNKKRFRRRFR